MAFPSHSAIEEMPVNVGIVRQESRRHLLGSDFGFDSLVPESDDDRTMTGLLARVVANYEMASATFMACGTRIGREPGQACAKDCMTRAMEALGTSVYAALTKAEALSKKSRAQVKRVEFTHTEFVTILTYLKELSASCIGTNVISKCGTSQWMIDSMVTKPMLTTAVQTLKLSHAEVVSKAKEYMKKGSHCMHAGIGFVRQHAQVADTTIHAEFLERQHRGTASGLPTVLLEDTMQAGKGG